MITEAVHDALIIIYAPASAPDASIESAASRLRERLAEFAGATATRAAICA
jgi:DNA/RNA-binding domain of Phe-tRNA-synthetase-like protein